MADHEYMQVTMDEAEQRLRVAYQSLGLIVFIQRDSIKTEDAYFTLGLRSLSDDEEATEILSIEQRGPTVDEQQRYLKCVLTVSNPGADVFVGDIGLPQLVRLEYSFLICHLYYDPRIPRHRAQFVVCDFLHARDSGWRWFGGFRLWGLFLSADIGTWKLYPDKGFHGGVRCSCAGCSAVECAPHPMVLHWASIRLALRYLRSLWDSHELRILQHQRVEEGRRMVKAEFKALDKMKIEQSVYSVKRRRTTTQPVEEVKRSRVTLTSSM